MKKATQPKSTKALTAKRFAAWIARRHLASDPGVREVLYLPANAPAKEIRLLEVNVSLKVPEAEKAEPLEYPLDDDMDFRVLAADITRDQWKAIQDDEPLLPVGWELTGFLSFKRGKSRE